MNYITPSLYSSWSYWHTTDFSKFDNKDLLDDTGNIIGIDYVCDRMAAAARQEYLDYLARKPRYTTEAMRRGIDFEAEVRRALDGATDVSASAQEIAKVLTPSCLWQVPCACECAGIMLKGIADAVNCGMTFDIKSREAYSEPHWGDSIQHLMYMRALNCDQHCYLIGSGKNAYAEDYARDDALLESRVIGFLKHLENDPEAFSLWIKNWNYKG